MGQPYKIQRKSGAVWRTVGKARSNVSVAFDQFKSTVRNGQSGQQFRIQQGKRTVREAVAS
jgi:hypothetical protein